MANVRRTRQTDEKALGLKSEEFVPPSAWTEDSQSHCLLVDLPGFKKDDVKILVETSGQITIKGERKAIGKITSFQKTYNVPEGSDVKRVSGRFEGEMLYVTIPKQVIEEKKRDAIQEKLNEKITNVIADPIMKDDAKTIKHGHGHIHGHDHKDEKNETNDGIEGKHEKKKVKKQKTMLEKVMKKFKMNKGILIGAVLAFSLGVLVGRYIEPYGHYAALHNAMADE